jgi:hypothetical protein
MHPSSSASPCLSSPISHKNLKKNIFCTSKASKLRTSPLRALAPRLRFLTRTCVCVCVCVCVYVLF